jgi:hypothetical protein
MRAAVLGWVLADMENADTDKVTKMCLLHDIAESRIGKPSLTYPGTCRSVWEGRPLSCTGRWTPGARGRR